MLLLRAHPGFLQELGATGYKPPPFPGALSTVPPRDARPPGLAAVGGEGHTWARWHQCTVSTCLELDL